MSKKRRGKRKRVDVPHTQVIRLADRHVTVVWGWHRDVWAWSVSSLNCQTEPEMRAEWLRGETMAMRRREAADNARPVRAADPIELAERMPLLADHLTMLAYEDGKPRQTCTLLIFAQDGVWKAFLRDRDAGEFLPCAAPGGITELLLVLEDQLGSDCPVWRKDRLSGHEEANRAKKRA